MAFYTIKGTSDKYLSEANSINVARKYAKAISLLEGDAYIYNSKFALHDKTPVTSENTFVEKWSLGIKV